MSRILVAYGTNSGSTAEVAQTIAGELSDSGRWVVDVRPFSEIDHIDEYKAVIIGAPLIVGWQRSARTFIKANRKELAGKRVAYFCTGMSLTQTDTDHVEQIPVWKDPLLATPPKNANKLGIKERYACPNQIVRPMLHCAPEVKPISVAIFGGKLEYFRLNIFHLLFVMVIIQAQPGDRRNWPFVKSWAFQLRESLNLT